MQIDETMTRGRRRVAGIAAFTLAATLVGCATSAPDPRSHAPSPAVAAPGAQEVDYRTLGAPDAPVTVIEFTDLQCPYCARFALETWPRLRERYVETGRVRFVSRDLPLGFHAHALPAAVAARCAGEQGAFWDYREALFRGQARLATAPYVEIARRFGLDPVRFEACRTDPAATASVREDAAIAARNGIGTTPTFVIGRLVDGQFRGEVLSGAQPFEAFAERIDALVSAEPPQR